MCTAIANPAVRAKSLAGLLPGGSGPAAPTIADMAPEDQRRVKFKGVKGSLLGRVGTQPGSILSTGMGA